MNFNEIKNIANEYADLFIQNEKEFIEKYNDSILLYTVSEQIAIVDLMNIYCLYKTGDIDRVEALDMQKDIRETYEGELAKVI